MKSNCDTTGLMRKIKADTAPATFGSSEVLASDFADLSINAAFSSDSSVDHFVENLLPSELVSPAFINTFHNPKSLFLRKLHL